MYYLITFCCYGTWLHGDELSVDPKHNVFDTPFLKTNPDRVRSESTRQDQAPYELDHHRRQVVLECIQGVCRHRKWNLLAAHVRSTHVHVVVEANVSPEKVMNDFKAYASRGLNQAGLDGPERKRWARHGSTRWLEAESNDNVSTAVRYVVDQQGEPMAVFPAP